MMTPDLDDLTARERRLCEVIAAYYQASEEGHAPGLRTLIQEHPDLQAELARYFFEQEVLHQVTEPLRAPDDIDRKVAFPGSSRFQGGEDVETLHDDSASVRADLAGPGQLADGVLRFGDYELLEKLAIGGMGVIYKARQVSLNRNVALKMIRSGEFATESDIRRFRAEAETIADLDHPNIVPIYEVGEHGGYHYFSMKLLEGGTLANHLDRYFSDPRAAARIVGTLGSAVLHAHRRGILHRDLKPSNILLDAKGEPLIADFGLAKRLDATTDLTAPGAVVGTPSYFAPEIAEGRRGAVTTATDVYGLGAILYALLTGRAPFHADTVWEMIEKVKEQPPQPPRQINPRVDADLQTICLKCLEKDPGSRYPGARDVTEELDRWSRGEPIDARPSNWHHRAWLWCRHPARQSEAGRYAVVIGLMLAAWAVAGITTISLGIVTDPIPRFANFQVLLCLILGYLPMVWLGSCAISRKPWAIRAGLFHGAALMGLNTVHALGFCFLDVGQVASESEPAMRSTSFTLFYIVIAFIFAEYVVANISLSANRRKAPPGTS